MSDESYIQHPSMPERDYLRTSYLCKYCEHRAATDYCDLCGERCCTKCLKPVDSPHAGSIEKACPACQDELGNYVPEGS